MFKKFIKIYHAIVDFILNNLNGSKAKWSGKEGGKK